MEKQMKGIVTDATIDLTPTVDFTDPNVRKELWAASRKAMAGCTKETDLSTKNKKQSYDHL